MEYVQVAKGPVGVGVRGRGERIEEQPASPTRKTRKTRNGTVFERADVLMLDPEEIPKGLSDTGSVDPAPGIQEGREGKQFSLTPDPPESIRSGVRPPL